MATHTALIVQQQQASTYNHPCGDLLDGGRRREYLDAAVPLYRASIEGDLKAAKVILQGREYLVRYSITENMETPLHIAAAGHSTEFVRYLVNKMSRVDMELQNKDGNTAFCVAAISGNVAMVKVMFEKNQALPIICGSENKTPLYLAAFHGNRDMVTFLYDQLNQMMVNYWTNDNLDRVLLKCVQAGIFDVALRILKDKDELPQYEHLWDMLLLLAQKQCAFYENRPFYENRLENRCLPLIDWVTRTGLKESNATPFLRFVWKKIMKYPKDVIDKLLRGPMIEKDETETYPSQLLFIAAKMNNTQFLVELIHEYPDLILKRNDDGQTIFHIAASHRHKDIYRLLYEIGSMKALITPITDQKGNNILHLVGKKPDRNADEDWVTSPFQTFSELLWYKEVEDILPPPFREVKNAEGQTPKELFIENHRKLASEGMKSISDTINISMVVAALVCMIGFTVIYSIPGGFHQENGLPMFLHNKYFIAFVVLDAISFILSSSSIILFLSIILSRDLERLLIKWVTGQLALLSSVFFLVMAFILSFFILYINSTWTYIIYPIAYVILNLYCAACFFLVADVVTPVYGTRIWL